MDRQIMREALLREDKGADLPPLTFNSTHSATSAATVTATTTQNDSTATTLKSAHSELSSLQVEHTRIARQLQDVQSRYKDAILQNSKPSPPPLPLSHYSSLFHSILFYFFCYTPLHPSHVGCMQL